MSISNKLKTFVRYDIKGIIVPGSAILSKEIPKNGIWSEIFLDIDYGNSIHNNLKAFIQYTKDGKFIPSSNILVIDKPNVGRWKQINVYYRNSITTTTTTTQPLIPAGAITTLNGEYITAIGDGYITTI